MIKSIQSPSETCCSLEALDFLHNEAELETSLIPATTKANTANSLGKCGWALSKVHPNYTAYDRTIRRSNQWSWWTNPCALTSAASIAVARPFQISICVDLQYDFLVFVLVSWIASSTSPTQDKQQGRNLTLLPVPAYDIWSGWMLFLNCPSMHDITHFMQRLQNISKFAETVCSRHPPHFQWPKLKV